MEARIYQPAKTATSSGRFRTRSWVVKMEPTSPARPDVLMGWIGSDDTTQQIELRFPSCEAAVAYCERNNIAYSISNPQQQGVRPKAYADNFIRKV